MFERYTDHARRVVVLGQDIARTYGSIEITEGHLLIGLLVVCQENDPFHPLIRVLEGHRISHSSLEAILKPEGTVDYTEGSIPFSPPAKKMLELSLREALSLGNNYIGVEHLALAAVRLARESNACAWELLGAKSVAELWLLRSEIQALLQNQITSQLLGPIEVACPQELEDPLLAKLDLLAALTDSSWSTAINRLKENIEAPPHSLKFSSTERSDWLTMLKNMHGQFGLSNDHPLVQLKVLLESLEA